MSERKRYQISKTYHDGDHRHSSSISDESGGDDSDDIEELKRLAAEDYSFTERDKRNKFHDVTYDIYDITHSYGIDICWTEPFKYNYPLVWIYEQKESEND